MPPVAKSGPSLSMTATGPASAPPRQPASPLARRIAQNAGIVLNGMTGSGPRGRIVRRDVMALIEAPASMAARAIPDMSPQPKAPVSPASFAGEITPHSGMRRTIAARLTQSKATIPHFYLAEEVPVDALLALRRDLSEDGGKASDFLPMISS